MRNKPMNITVLKNVGEGLSNSTLPSFLNVGQRHFEKEKPSGRDSGESGVGFILPVDLLGLTLTPSLTADIESVEMVYRKKANKTGGENPHA